MSYGILITLVIVVNLFCLLMRRERTPVKRKKTNNKKPS